MAKSKRNKFKNSNKGLIIPLPITFFLILGATLALVYICIGSRGQTLGNKISKLEKEQENLNRRYNYELAKWESMTSAPKIEEALAKHQLEMAWPKESQIVRLPHPDAWKAKTDGKGELASAANTRASIY